MEKTVRLLWRQQLQQTSQPLRYSASFMLQLHAQVNLWLLALTYLDSMKW